MSPLQPPVLRVLYRSLLRATRNGKYPELLGAHGYNAWSSSQTTEGRQISARTLPSCPADVRSLLREAFTPASIIVENDDASSPDAEGSSNSQKSDIDGIIDPFAVLRQASVFSSVILPSHAELPSTLPIFDYPSSSLLPWEQTMFNFFEPRYRLLAKIATEADGGGYFLLRAGMVGVSSLLKILKHWELPNGDIGVLCAAGPRVLVSDEDRVDVVRSFPLAIATSFEIIHDDEVGCTQEDDMREMRAQCIDIMCKTSSSFIRNMEETGVPPVDPEAFSFWSLRYLLGSSEQMLSTPDTKSRLRWLWCRSTKKRMDFVVKSLEENGRTKRKNESPSEPSCSS